MGKAGSANQPVVDYHLSIHYGISVEVDSIHGVYVGEKVAWEGNVSTASAISINAPQLFGGNKKEGGVAGTAYFLPGRPDQVVPEYLANKVGRTSATCPAYRGVASLWFTGTRSPTVQLDHMPGILFGGLFGGLFTGIYGQAGFMWSSNNPYLRDIWMKVRRSPKGLGDSTSQMLGASVTASVRNNSVTIGNTTETVTQGVPATIGGATVLLNRKSLTINGTEIIVNLDRDSSSDPKNREPTVTVGSVTAPLATSGSTSVNGWTITLMGEHRVTVPFGYVTVANFSARQNARVDANPVHIIYECMTNPDWGMGGAPSSFDTPTWIAAAQTIYDERFGMSIIWAQQSSVEAFVGEIIDHIQATIFINPRNGLWTIKLIRDDYDIDTLPVLNRDNCVIRSFDRKAWGETTNEVVVTWTNPANEQEETVQAQNLANITIQGAVISDGRNYYGIRDPELAMYVAKRDLRMASTPLAIFELEVDRDAWNFVPGGVVVLDYPEPDYEISRLVLRISKIDYGRPGDMTIKVNAVEDIFALPLASYGMPPITEWVPTSEVPRNFDYAQILTAPLYFATNALQAASLSGLAFPEALTMILAAQTSDDTFTFDVMSDSIDPNGNPVELDFGTFTTVGRALLEEAVPQETVSNVNFTSYVGELAPNINVFAIIGSGGDQDIEIALISAYDEDDGFTLQRGVLDTVPRAWSANTPVWFILTESNIYEETPRVGGETVTYKLLSRTSLGRLDELEVVPVSATLTDRPWLPNRPGNVKLNGTAFGTIDLGLATSAQVTWANRNRLMEPTQVVLWTDASITPEEGQTTRITTMRLDRSVIATYSGLTGTSHELDVLAAFDGESQGIVRVTAEREGLESLQGHEITVSVTPQNARLLSGDEAGSTLAPSGDAQSGTDIRLWS